MGDIERDQLPPLVARGAALLRDTESTVPPVWRSTLLERVAGNDDRDSRESRWSVRPIVAVAAGLACVAAGALVTFATMRRATPLREPAFASATSSTNAARVASDGRVASDARVVSDVPSTPVRFAVVAPNAVHVSVVGDFNRWNPTALPMRRSSDGRTWQIDVPLAPGRYIYGFVVDGHVARDSAAAETTADEFGTSNSVVLVKGS